MNSKNLVDHFDQRATSYDEKGLWVRDPSVMSLTTEFLDLSSGQRLLDIGAGTGAVLENAILACPSLGSCVALDISLEMLSAIRDPRIEKCVHDASEIPFPNDSFDIALCRQVLHYFDDIDRSLAEIFRVLDKKGVVIIAQITPFNEKDEEWWKKILMVRQPLRKHFVTLNDIITALIKVSFLVTKVSQVRAKESLNSWLARYSDSQEQVDEVRNLHLNAPLMYQTIHKFQQANGDIIFDNCWTFIRACKPSFFEADQL